MSSTVSEAMAGKNPKNNFSLNFRRKTVISRTISRLLVFVYAWVDSSLLFTPALGAHPSLPRLDLAPFTFFVVFMHASL